MLKLLFRKWWVILLEGILLIILSIYIFNNPVAVLAGLSLWFGVLVVISGVIGIIKWFFTDTLEREEMSLLWSIFTAAFGVLLLNHVLVTMKTLTLVFSVWMLITGMKLIQSGWLLKARSSSGWLMILVGLLSATAAVMMFFNIGMGAIGISTVLGLQVLLTGIALMFLSFAKKAVVSIVKEKIEALKSDI
jgi:uncharacterized membrane protein HdeD (DUF308 family)